MVAFYLPQYHRIPENDAWWGEGFTDWTNVAAARPSYPNHTVPNLPADLGMYDLLSREARARQAEMAREHGIYGFCYYFYWFGRRRLLERPLDLMLADGEPSLPFCLCWANEPWTRRWDGRESDILMAQEHHRLRDLAILDDLLPFFEDPRYIRIDGRPLLLIYRQGLIPDAAGFAADLRADAVRRGQPGLYLCNVLSIGDVDRRAEGFDAAVAFPPHGTLGAEIRPRHLGAKPDFKGRIYDYASVVRTSVGQPVPTFQHFPGVMPRWDNTARKRLAAHVFHGSTPELFERWLRRAALTAQRVTPQAPLVFVNSWNEWAEGAHLEPDQRSGRSYLEVVRRVVRSADAVDAGAATWVETDSETLAPTARPTVQRDRGVEGAVLRPGVPDEASVAAAGRGVAWIDEVNGQPLRVHTIRATNDRTLQLAGWFYGDLGRGGRRGNPGYIVLSSDRGIWHAPIRERPRRSDVLRAMLARGRRSRRFVRALDRMPAGLARQILRLWALGGDRVGFDVWLSASGLPAGQFQVSFVDVTNRGPLVIVTEFELTVE